MILRVVPPAVSVIMIFLDAERFIEEAIASARAQRLADWELILVDDGSSDASTAIARGHAARDPARVRYVEHEGHANRGMSPSRNEGLRHACGRYVAFLDADDVWEPEKLSEQVALMEAEPRAGAVFGTPLYWRGWTGDPDDRLRDAPLGLGFEADRLYAPPEALLSLSPFGTAPVPCPSDVLVRRSALERVGGFESSFDGAFEDVAFYVKLLLREPILPTSRQWTRYRIHPDSCMIRTVRDGLYEHRRLKFLNWFEEYLYREGSSEHPVMLRLRAVLAPYRHPLSALAMADESTTKMLQTSPNPVPTGSAVTTVSWGTPDREVGQVWVSENGGLETLFAEGSTGRTDADWIQPGRIYEFRLYAGRARKQLLDSVRVSRVADAGVGTESFGSLRRVVPVSTAFGYDRGQPIDRYFIERFLEANREDIKGRVLEIGEALYTRRFGGPHVVRSDVLHVVAGNPEATIVADLARGDEIPSESFDCILLIQTLQFIYDVPAAIRTIHRILRPGGVLLATFPGLSQRSYDQWADSWYWGFTSSSASRLFACVFDGRRVAVATYGNVLVTAAFLYGLASSELTPAELDYIDDRYETLVTVRAAKDV